MGGFWNFFGIFRKVLQKFCVAFRGPVKDTVACMNLERGLLR